MTATAGTRKTSGGRAGRTASGKKTTRKRAEATAHAPEAPPPAPDVASPGPAATAQAGADPETALVPLGERQAILDTLHDVRFEDYFRILRLDPDAPLSDDDVRLAHRRLASLFDRARFQGRVSDDFMDHLIEIADGLDDARDVLADALLRERYRRALRQLPASPLAP